MLHEDVVELRDEWSTSLWAYPSLIEAETPLSLYGRVPVSELRIEFMKSLSSLIGLSIVLALVTGCSSNSTQDFNALPAPQTNETPAPLPGDIDQYLIQPGDRLSINVVGHDQLSGTFPVEANGTVNLPSIGMVQASGRAVTDLQSELVNRYSATINNPQLLVSVLNATQ
jgi:protein involved in polysaccharide export with SLBB domain